jgi:DNA-binding transcriptional LysR family regulator
MKLDDLRLFASVAETRSFTAAARGLGIPKQTLSRRVAALEEALGCALLHRTTRKVTLTEMGASFAARCAEVVRLAEEAARSVDAAKESPQGLLRVTADPVFGEAFLGPVLLEYARRWPAVRLDVVLTRRRVDLVEELFDVAFRVGAVDDARLVARTLGPATIRYCASPAYLKRRGAPSSPDDLASHDCIVVASDPQPMRWPFKDGKLVTVGGRIRTTSFAMAHQAARAGMGIAILPEFACLGDVRAGKLVTVLDEHVAAAGDVWLVYPRTLSARVRRFVELVLERFREQPWLKAGAPGRPKRRRARPSKRATRRPPRRSRPA